MSIEVRGLNKRFGTTVVCDNLNLDIPSGGWSRCRSGRQAPGKADAAAHHRRPRGPGSRRTVLFHGEDATNADVRRAPRRFVFKHYALFGTCRSSRTSRLVGLRVRPRTRPAERRRSAPRSWAAEAGPARLDRRYFRTSFRAGSASRASPWRARCSRAPPKVLLLDEPFGAPSARVRKICAAGLLPRRDERDQRLRHPDQEGDGSRRPGSPSS